MVLLYNSAKNVRVTVSECKPAVAVSVSEQLEKGDCFNSKVRLHYIIP